MIKNDEAAFRRPTPDTKVTQFSESESVGWYVRLSNKVDAALHKRPIESEWQNKGHTLEEAQDWIERGFGVGINLAKAAGIAVIDMDTDTPATRAFAETAARYGALVCKSVRGYHVFFAVEGWPERTGKSLVRLDGIEVEAELYHATPRQVVLPARGTPRAELGGRVWYSGGVLLDRDLALSDLHEALLSLPTIPISRAGERGGGSGAVQGIPEGETGFIKAFFGRPISKITLAQARERLKAAKEGERNNVLFAASVVYGYRGGDSAELEAIARQIFSPRDPEARHDFAGARETIRNGLKYGEALREKAGKEHPTKESPLLRRVKFLAERQQEGTFWQTLVSAMAEAVAEVGGGKKVGAEPLVLAWLDVLKERGIPIRMAYKNGSVLLIGHIAVQEGALGGLLAELSGGGVSLSSDSEARIYAALRSMYPTAPEVLLVSSSPEVYKGVAYLLCQTDTEGAVVVAVGFSPRVARIYKPKVDALPEGVYAYYTPHTRRVGAMALIEADLEDVRRNGINAACVREVIDEIAEHTYCSSDLPPHAMACGAIAGTMARGVVVIEGEAGAGKSTLAKKLTILKQGFDVGIDTADKREFIQVAAACGAIVIDEAQNLSKQIENLVKQAATGKEVAQRELYTNTGIVLQDITASFLICGTNVSGLQSDTLRRALRLELALRDRPAIPEWRMHERIKCLSRKWHVAACALAAYMATGPLGDRVPYMFLSETKTDLALGYWRLCKAVGVSDKDALLAWQNLRYGAVKKATPEWRVILELLDTDPEFARKLSEGITYADLSTLVNKALAETGERAGDLKRTLELTRAQAAAVFRLFGYALERYEVRTDTKTKGRRRGIRVRRLHTNNGGFLELTPEVAALFGVETAIPDLTTTDLPPTELATEAPTEASLATEAPAKMATEASLATELATEAPTEAATEASLATEPPPSVVVVPPILSLGAISAFAEAAVRCMDVVRPLKDDKRLWIATAATLRKQDPVVAMCLLIAAAREFSEETAHYTTQLLSAYLLLKSAQQEVLQLADLCRRLGHVREETLARLENLQTLAQNVETKVHLLLDSIHRMCVEHAPPDLDDGRGYPVSWDL